MKKYLFIILCSIAFSCATTKTTTYWVSGSKVICSNGVRKTKCLQVHRGELTNPMEWELFYVPIEGFVFREGIMQKIQVTEQNIPSKDVPADASSKKITLLKVLETKKDVTVLLNGTWEPDRIGGNLIKDKSVDISLVFDISNKEFNGSDGCNLFFGLIKSVDDSLIVLEPQGSTKKLCLDVPVSSLFIEALHKTRSYHIVGERLILYSDEDKELLSFFSKNNAENTVKLDVWETIRIEGELLQSTSSIPRMEVNLRSGKVSGTDGCNHYSATIEKLTSLDVLFGPIASTKKMCLDNEIPMRFRKGLQSARSYKFVKDLLILYDFKGKETIAFQKK